MFRRDVRNLAPTNPQNPTYTREFLAQTRKITKGILSLLLYPVVPDWVFELSLGYLMQLVVCITAFCWLFRRMMEQAGFPPSKHRLKYCGWLVLYIAVLYATGAFFTRIAGAFVLLRLPILPYALFSLLLGAGLYGIKFWKYGKDERLRERI